MKKLFLVLFASAAVFASCSDDNSVEEQDQLGEFELSFGDVADNVTVSSKDANHGDDNVTRDDLDNGLWYLIVSTPDGSKDVVQNLNNPQNGGNYDPSTYTYTHPGIKYGLYKVALTNYASTALDSVSELEDVVHDQTGQIDMKYFVSYNLPITEPTGNKPEDGIGIDVNVMTAQPMYAQVEVKVDTSLTNYSIYFWGDNSIKIEEDEFYYVKPGVMTWEFNADASNYTINDSGTLTQALEAGTKYILNFNPQSGGIEITLDVNDTMVDGGEIDVPIG